MRSDKPQTGPIEMGRVILDGKGRAVIPALVRQSAFQGLMQLEARVYLYPTGDILLRPIRPKPKAPTAV